MTCGKERLFEGKSLSDWGRELGVSREMIRQRMNRWGTVHTDQIATIKEAKREARAKAIAERKEAGLTLAEGRVKLPDQKYNDLLKRLTLGKKGSII